MIEIENDEKNWAGCLPNRARWSPSDHVPLVATVAIVSNSNVYQHVGSQKETRPTTPRRASTPFWQALKSTATAIEVDQRRHLTIWEKENKKLANDIHLGKADRPASAYSYSGQSLRPRSAATQAASIAQEASVWDPSEVQYIEEAETEEEAPEATKIGAAGSVWRDMSKELEGPRSAMDVKTGVWSTQWNPYASGGAPKEEKEEKRPATAGSMRVHLDGKGLRGKV